MTGYAITMLSAQTDKEVTEGLRYARDSYLPFPAPCLPDAPHPGRITLPKTAAAG